MFVFPCRFATQCEGKLNACSLFCFNFKNDRKYEVIQCSLFPPIFSHNWRGFWTQCFSAHSHPKSLTFICIPMPFFHNKLTLSGNGFSTNFCSDLPTKISFKDQNCWWFQLEDLLQPRLRLAACKIVNNWKRSEQKT